MNNDYEKAKEYFEKMQRKGFAVSDTTRIAFVRLSFRQGSLRSAEERYEAMKNEGIAPTESLYNAMIKRYCEEHDIKRVEQLLRRKTEAPSLGTLGMLVAAYCDEKQFDKALDYFEEQKQSPDCREKDIQLSYNTLIQAYYDDNQIDKARALFEKSAVRLEKDEEGQLDCHGLIDIVSFWALRPLLQDLRSGESVVIITGRGNHGKRKPFAQRDFIQKKIAEEFPRLAVFPTSENAGALHCRC
jgi:pentatricopeptide repeat protein